MSHQKAYSEAISVAERGVYELSHHQALSEASGSSFILSQSASEAQALNHIHQENDLISHDHSASESSSRNRTMEVGLKGQAGAEVKAGVAPVSGSLSAGGNAGVQWTLGHNETEQRSFSHSKSAENANYSQNMETALRGVSGVIIGLIPKKVSVFWIVFSLFRSRPSRTTASLSTISTS